MLLESSVERFNEKARLISPIFSAIRSQNACFKFFYHMYGQSVGKLSIYIKPESLDIDAVIYDEKYHIWEKSGNQKNIWRESIIQMEELNENFQLIIEGTSIGSHLGDIAIDDVSLIDIDECLNEIPGTTTEETGGIFDIESCVNRCNETHELVLQDIRITRGPGIGGFIKKCYCYNDCYLDESCCPDYQPVCIFNDVSGSDTDNLDVTERIVFSSSIPTSSVNTILYEMEVTTTMEVETTTENYEYIENETEMNEIKNLEELNLIENSSTFSYFFWIIFTILIISSATYGIYYKYYRKNFNSICDGSEVRFITEDTEELLEFSNNI